MYIVSFYTHTHIYIYKMYFNQLRFIYENITIEYVNNFPEPYIIKTSLNNLKYKRPVETGWLQTICFINISCYQYANLASWKVGI